MKLSIYKKKLTNTFWSFEFCLLFPLILINKSIDTQFQPNYKSNRISLNSVLVFDTSDNKCYIEIRVLGLGCSYHFYKTTK